MYNIKYELLFYFSKGSRYSTARAYLRQASKRNNLHILLNAVGSRVIVDPATKKVTGVEYIKNGMTKSVGVIKEVIVINLIIKRLKESER